MNPPRSHHRNERFSFQKNIVHREQSETRTEFTFSKLRVPLFAEKTDKIFYFSPSLSLFFLSITVNKFSRAFISGRDGNAEAKPSREKTPPPRRTRVRTYVRACVRIKHGYVEIPVFARLPPDILRTQYSKDQRYSRIGTVSNDRDDNLPITLARGIWRIRNEPNRDSCGPAAVSNCSQMSSLLDIRCTN